MTDALEGLFVLLFSLDLLISKLIIENMKRIILFVIALFSMGISVSAQSLMGTNITLDPGSSATVEISMFGVGNYVSSGFIISLPEEFTISNGSGVASNHEIQTNMLSKNKMKVAVYSFDNDAFDENVNGIVSFSINADVDKGTYQGTISSIELASADARLTKLSNVTFQIEVTGPETILGDANGDGNVNVTDYTAMSHYIMGNPPEDFNEKAADTNGDGKINVADYTGLAHLILYGTVEKPESAKLNTSVQQVE